MSTTARLLGHLYRPISRNADPLHALSVSYPSAPGALTISIDQCRLRTSVVGVPTAALDIDLEGRSIFQLASLINGVPGYAAAPGGADAAGLAAITLIDVQGAPGGAPLYAYRSLVWAYMHAVGRQLDLARAAIADALAELRIDTATGDWLDLWRELTIGGRRLSAESDAALRTRIVSTMLQLKCNNRALERVVLAQTGVAVSALDIPWYLGDRTLFTHGGPFWRAGQVTNSATARTPPAAHVDASVLANFGLPTLPDGRPQAPFAPGQALTCAIAVVFPDGAGCGDYCAVMRVVDEFRAAGTVALGFKSAASAMPGDTDVGLVYRRWRCACARGDITNFDDYDRTLLVPSDSTELMPPPYGGLYFPSGGQVALEDRNGRVLSLRVVAETWFYGLAPARVLATGTDPGMLVYGLSMTALPGLRPDSGDTIIDVTPSDVVPITPTATGGIYVITGGVMSYRDADNVNRSMTVSDDTWIPDGVARVNLTGTSGHFRAVAFIRGGA